MRQNGSWLKQHPVLSALGSLMAQVSQKDNGTLKDYPGVEDHTKYTWHIVPERTRGVRFYYALELKVEAEPPHAWEVTSTEGVGWTTNEPRPFTDIEEVQDAVDAERNRYGYPPVWAKTP